MLTKNGNCLFGNKIPTSPCSWILTNGQELGSGSSVSPNYTSTYKICIGTGNGQPSINDYNLENRIYGITTISSSFSFSNNYTKDYMFSVQTLFKNNTSEDIVVKELGIIRTGNSWSYDWEMLISREVLQTPIIIKPNKTYAFSIII